MKNILFYFLLVLCLQSPRPLPLLRCHTGTLPMINYLQSRNICEKSIREQKRVNIATTGQHSVLPNCVVAIKATEYTTNLRVLIIDWNRQSTG